MTTIIDSKQIGIVGALVYFVHSATQRQGATMAKKSISISFDYDNDKDIWRTLRAQAADPQLAFNATT